MKKNAKVAVIDVGSNSIKLLVAASDEPLRILYEDIALTRISTGIGGAKKLLQPENMEASQKSIEMLIASARAFSPQSIHIYATSAVRSAENGKDFKKRIESTTKCPFTILSGSEEATIIAEGVLTDPLVHNLGPFAIVDLGGGSLEYILCKNAKIQHAFSLELGSVRLLEQCARDPQGPFTEEDRSRVKEAVIKAWKAVNCPTPPTKQTLVGTGGTLGVARRLLAYHEDSTFENTPPEITTSQMEGLLQKLAPMPTFRRAMLPKLPANRADIYPTALATLLQIAELAQADQYIHSTRNLRYGLALRELQE